MGIRMHVYRTCTSIHIFPLPYFNNMATIRSDLYNGSCFLLFFLLYLQGRIQNEGADRVCIYPDVVCDFDMGHK